MIELILFRQISLARRLLGDEYETYIRENIEDIIIKGFVPDETFHESRVSYTFGEEISIMITTDKGRYYCNFVGTFLSINGDFNKEKDVEKLRETLKFKILNILIND